MGRSAHVPVVALVVTILLAALWMGPPVSASPYFLVDSEIEWQTALATHIQPMTAAEWSDYMLQWNLYLEPPGEPYPTNDFLPPELYVWPGGGGGGTDPEDAGLVMAWQPPKAGSYSSAWKYIYTLDPDLTGATINVTVTAPQFSPIGNQVNSVSFAIQDAAGSVRAWHWNCGPGNPIAWNTPTQVTINPMLLSVNAANPPASGFANNPLFNIAQSTNFIVDENAVWVAQQGVPPPGQPVPAIWNYWHNLYVTPPIPAKNPDPLKWSQPPVEVQAGMDPPVFYGWDEQSLYGSPPICADDWECTDPRPVTDIHWWGSFIGWTQPEPPQLPIAFHLAIWKDVPKDEQNLFSHPGTMVWEHYCDNFTWNFAGYDKDPRGLYQDEACFQFHQYLPEDEWFYQEPGPDGHNVYWLSIAAIYDGAPRYPWGWKTRPHFFNDDAVRIFQVSDPSGIAMWPPHVGWSWLQGAPITYPDDVSWDLAFELTTIELEEWDWGDAPDPPYPTLSPAGASHRIVQGFCLGAQVDAEGGGQPDANALGDDNNGVDDEDGVTFPAGIIPGQSATAIVTVTSTLSQAFLDAWIDFNGNGVWTDAGEQIAASMPVTAGANAIAFAVPASTPAGVKRFARFRLSSTGGLPVGGPANDGEVEDYEVPIGYKWVQKPDLTPTGIDVNATAPYILADDFLCTVTGPITDIHVWGSWRNDILPVEDPSQVKFRLSLHKDIPATAEEYSRPGEVLWLKDFQPGEFQVTRVTSQTPEGWMDPPNVYQYPGDYSCWRYDFQIEKDPFIQRGMPDIPVVYWLDVQAEPLSPDAVFGWKTSLEHWNDDAVWGQGIEPFIGPWYELRYPPAHEMQGQSIDLAFAITGTAQGTGSLTVTRNHAISDHFWTLGGALDPYNEMLSLNGSADATEAVFWNSVTLQASGTGDDAADITSVTAWADNDNDGKVTAPDTLLGSGAYGVDNGTVTIGLAPPPLVPASGTVPVVIAYTMGSSASPGRTYRFDLTAAAGIGQASGMPVAVTITPAPLPSATKIVGLRPISIGMAKKLPAGTQFLLEGKVCTADFQTNMQLFYIEESDRSSGIGVFTPAGDAVPVSIWDRVSVLGTCTLINGTELVVSPDYVLVTPGIAPPMGSPRFAVGMNNKWTGGGQFGDQPAVIDNAWNNTYSMGLNNVGLLVTTWGNVTYHQGTFPLPPMAPPVAAGDVFWIDDGTNLQDGFTTVTGGQTYGIACWLPSPYAGLPNLGEYWGVTGILRAIPSQFLVRPVRMLVPRAPGDLVRYR